MLCLCIQEKVGAHAGCHAGDQQHVGQGVGCAGITTGKQRRLVNDLVWVLLHMFGCSIASSL